MAYREYFRSGLDMHVATIKLCTTAEYCKSGSPSTVGATHECVPYVRIWSPDASLSDSKNEPL